MTINIQNNGKKYIDPLTIKSYHMPVSVLFQDCRSFISLCIRLRTGGDKNHSAIMRRTGYIVSQEFTGYREIPIKKFMKIGQNMKFISMAKIATQNEIAEINKMIDDNLSKPWYRKLYDFLGLIGQATALKWIQSPWHNYCSEVDATYWRAIKKLRKYILFNPSPEGLNKAFKRAIVNGLKLEILGYWWSG